MSTHTQIEDTRLHIVCKFSDISYGVGTYIGDALR